MSIINEALRKTQQIRKMENARRIQTTEEVSPEMPPDPMVAAEASGKSLLFPQLLTLKMAGYLTFTILLLIMAITSYQYARNEKNHAVVMASPMKANKEKLAFTGVFVSDHSTIAVINKQPYHLGDMVNGMKIIAMDNDSVELQRQDKVIQIRAGATYLL